MFTEREFLAREIGAIFRHARPRIERCAEAVAQAADRRRMALQAYETASREESAALAEWARLIDETQSTATTAGTACAGAQRRTAGT